MYESIKAGAPKDVVEISTLEPVENGEPEYWDLTMT